ncbi:MAG: hypothetical protein HY791_30595 [Deltaproteobacteria bacterium]|nr:hypothetical protein [Deltaproteobacteria bacterium]
MKLLKHLLINSAAVGLIASCNGSETLTEAEENATFSAAVTQGGDTLDGTPSDASAPTGADEDAIGEGSDVNRDCSLGGVHDRLVARFDTDGDGVLSETERAVMEAEFSGRAGACGRGGHGRGDGEMRGEGGMGHGEGGMGEGLGHGRGGPPPELTDTGTVGGDRPEGCGHRGRGPLPFRRLLWIYDTDGDGALSDVEREILRADLEARGANLEARQLAEFDADGDGALSDTEIEAARAARRAEHEARRAADLATYDADGDGRLSHEERRAMHDARKAALEARFDADSNGSLDETETLALKEFLRSVVRGEAEPE